jgi:hypothetical protein
MTKAVLGRALAEELADHLVYDIGDSARAWIGSRKKAAETAGDRRCQHS